MFWWKSYFSNIRSSPSIITFLHFSKTLKNSKRTLSLSGEIHKSMFQTFKVFVTFFFLFLAFFQWDFLQQETGCVKITNQTENVKC